MIYLTQTTPGVNRLGLLKSNISDRVTSAIVQIDDLDWNYLPESRSWLFAFEPIKQHQWMALSRGCIDELMQNRHALLLLAHSEHVYIPDEMYFSTFLNSKLTKQKMIDKSPTWVHFSEGQWHPDWVSVKQAKLVDADTLFVRKVSMDKNMAETRDWIDEERERNDIELGFKNVLHDSEKMKIQMNVQDDHPKVLKGEDRALRENSETEEKLEASK